MRVEGFGLGREHRAVRMRATPPDVYAALVRLDADVAGMDRGGSRLGQITFLVGRGLVVSHCVARRQLRGLLSDTAMHMASCAGSCRHGALLQLTKLVALGAY